MHFDTIVLPGPSCRGGAGDGWRSTSSRRHPGDTQVLVNGQWIFEPKPVRNPVVSCVMLYQAVVFNKSTTWRTQMSGLTPIRTQGTAKSRISTRAGSWRAAWVKQSPRGWGITLLPCVDGLCKETPSGLAWVKRLLLLSCSTNSAHVPNGRRNLQEPLKSSRPWLGRLVPFEPTGVDPDKSPVTERVERRTVARPVAGESPNPKPQRRCPRSTVQTDRDPMPFSLPKPHIQVAPAKMAQTNNVTAQKTNSPVVD